MGAYNTPIPDLIELNALNAYATYDSDPSGGGQILGIVDDAVYSDGEGDNSSTRIAELNETSDADNGVLTIGGQDYSIELVSPADSNGSVTLTLADGSQMTLDGDDGASDVVFIVATPLGAGSTRTFMLVDDTVGDVGGIQSIQTRDLNWDPAGDDVKINAGQDNDMRVVCFCAGTLIATPDGARDVATLRAGDRVMTMDHGIQRLIWAGRSLLPADAPSRLAPIRIAAGALGVGLPQRDLRVSPQHRMLLRSPIAERLFDSPEVLIPAVKLLGRPGVTRDGDGPAPSYHHLLFRHHEIVFAEGAPSESLLLGPEARRVMPGAALRLAQIVARRSARPARRIVARRSEVEGLLARHAKNAKPLLAV